jgi:mRNA-degrading endonuclease RelE of RelBE toxin-antitoxin system
VKRVVFSAQAQADLAGLDRSIVLRIVGAINRFAATCAGDVKGLHGIHPPEFRLRIGDWRVRFHDHGDWIDVLRVGHRSEGYR